MILTEALAIKELEKAFGSFEAGTFKRTLEEIALLTNRKISEIEQAFKNAGLTPDSFSPPSGGGGDDDSSSSGSDGTDAPTFADTGNESSSLAGGGGGGTFAPVKIFTTLNIDGERFETVTQDALINLQKQGKKVII